MTRIHRNLPGVTDHAQHRALDHLGVRPSREIWLSLVLDILDRRAVLLSGDSGHGHGGRREVWLGALGVVRLRVVWSPMGGAIITVMPLRERALSHRPRQVDTCKHGQLTRPVPRRALALDRDWAAQLT